jgi:hypothetical protein
MIVFSGLDLVRGIILIYFPLRIICSTAIKLNDKVGKNQNLSFSYGKNFEKTITKTGNLIAASHFMTWLGSEKPSGN